MSIAQTDNQELEVPEDPCLDDDDDTRLWVGNLGTEITEYSLLKLMQTFGTLRKINFIYHKTGPDKGKPRGYCFVSFHTWEAAEKARQALDKKLLMSRKLFVKWAHRMKQDEIDFKKCKVKSAATTESATSQPPVVAAALSASSSVAAASTQSKIAAIEAKLKLMEQTQKDFSLNSTIQPPPGLHVLLHKQDSARPAPYRKFHKPRKWR